MQKSLNDFLSALRVTLKSSLLVQTVFAVALVLMVRRINNDDRSPWNLGYEPFLLFCILCLSEDTNGSPLRLMESTLSL